MWFSVVLQNQTLFSDSENESCSDYVKSDRSKIDLFFRKRVIPHMVDKDVAYLPLQ